MYAITAPNLTENPAAERAARLAAAIRSINARAVAEGLAAGKPGTCPVRIKSYATRANAERAAVKMARECSLDLGAKVAYEIVFFAHWGERGRYVPMLDYGTALRTGGGYACRAAAAGFVQY